MGGGGEEGLEQRQKIERGVGKVDAEPSTEDRFSLSIATNIRRKAIVFPRLEMGHLLPGLVSWLLHAIWAHPQPKILSMIHPHQKAPTSQPHLAPLMTGLAEIPLS